MVPGTVTANYAQLWFPRFRSGNFHVEDVSRTGSPRVENIDKFSIEIRAKLKMDQKGNSKPFGRDWFQKKATYLGSAWVD